MLQLSANVSEQDMTYDSIAVNVKSQEAEDRHTQMALMTSSGVNSMDPCEFERDISSTLYGQEDEEISGQIPYYSDDTNANGALYGTQEIEYYDEQTESEVEDEQVRAGELIWVDDACLYDDVHIRQYLPSPPNSLQGDFDEGKDFADCLSILGAQTPLDGNLAEEKWDVDKDTATYLSSIFALGNVACTDNASEEPVLLRDLKLEEPVLRTDNELDMLKLRRRNQPRLSTERLKQSDDDNEVGKGLEWSAKDYAALEEIDRVSRSEKLDVGKESMEYLQRIVVLTESSEEEVMQALLEEANQAKPHRLVTPPLLPLSPPFSPANLTAATAEIELTSTPENPDFIEHAMLERELLQADEMEHESEVQFVAEAPLETAKQDHIRLYSSFSSSPIRSSSPTLRRKRILDLRCETPLTPQEPSPDTTAKRAKTISFSAGIDTLIPLPDSDFTVDDPAKAELEFQTFVESVVNLEAESVEHHLRHEQLSLADTVLRMKAPEIETIDPAPPWLINVPEDETRSMLDGQRALMSYVRRELLREVCSWGGATKLERLLPWSPFPHQLGKVEVTEDLDDGLLESYMDELRLEEEPDCEALVTLPQGLLLLGAAEDDDGDIEAVSLGDDNYEDHGSSLDIEINTTDVRLSVDPGIETSNPGLMTTETQEAQCETETVPVTPALPPNDRAHKLAVLVERRRMRLNMQDSHAVEKTYTDSELADGHPGCSGNSGTLDSFLRAQGQAVCARPRVVHPRSPLPERHPGSQVTHVDPPSTDGLETITKQSPLPVPSLSGKLERPMSVVISSEFSSKRSLIRKIQELVPLVEFVERDVAANFPSVRASSRTATNPTEADLTLSPSTGLVVTTLQKLKQRPLPGQSSFFGIREKIERLSNHYERLIVLVSEGAVSTDGGAAPLQALDELDCSALAAFKGWAHVFGAELDVKYIAGGECELAKWIAATMAKHSSCDVSSRLLPEETTWECFLRNAGLNAFASQATLKKLKTSDESHAALPTSPALQSSMHGLHAFVTSSHEERVQQFGPMLGGEKVLLGVREALDRKWKALASWGG